MDIVKKFAWIVFVLGTLVASAQNVKVEKEGTRIKGDNTEGYAVELEGTTDEVTAALTKYIKTFAKTKMGANPITTTEVVINGTSYKTPVYATVKERSSGAIAWMGIKESEWANADEAQKVSKELERMMYDFGVKYYKDKIQLQIDESVRALQAVERTQQRLVAENKNLELKLENNAKEKIQLEKSIEVNKLENLTLNTRIEQNKKSQDSVAIAAEQIKKVVELHKERQKKVQ